MATIRDVASRAGVAVSTVSYVLSGERSVGPETSARVLEAVEALGYRINGVARSLKTGRTLTLGLIIPDIMNPFFTLVARGAEDTAIASGYNLILCNSGGDSQREEGYLELLPSRRVDGLIYMPGTAVYHEQIDLLARQGFPIIVIDESIDGIDVPSVVAQNREGAMEVGNYLATLGHESVDIIAGPPGLRTSEERTSGVIEALDRHGVRIGRVLHGDYRLESGCAAMRDVLDSGRFPTALFAANDLMAIGAVREIRARGYLVPDDMSITGFDDIPFASMISPALTTVTQPARAMGEAAAKLLLTLVQGHVPDERTVVLDTQLQIRDSTAAPRHGRKDVPG